MDTLWQMVCLPFNYLQGEFVYWVKRLINRLYSKRLPSFLVNTRDGTLRPQLFEIDYNWINTETKLSQEEQARQKIREKEQEAKRRQIMQMEHNRLQGL